MNGSNVVIDDRGVCVQWVIQLVGQVITDTRSIETLRTDVSKVARALCRRKNADWLGRGGMVKALPLVIEEEEQFVLDDRAANCTAEHIPAEQSSRVVVESVFPRVRVELVIAEELPQVAVEAVGT